METFSLFKTNTRNTENQSVDNLSISRVINEQPSEINQDDDTKNETSTPEAINNLTYIKNWSKILYKEGYEDAVKHGTNLSSFRNKLVNIINTYYTWCKSHQDDYQLQNDQKEEKYQTLMIMATNKIQLYKQKLEPIEEQINSTMKSLDILHHKPTKALDIFYLVCNVTCILALLYWCTFYYGSALTLSTISALELIDQNNNLVPLISQEHMMKGLNILFLIIPFIATIGLLRPQNYKKATYIGITAFTIFDVCIALLVENKIGEAYSVMGIDHAFDWSNFIILLMYGIGASSMATLDGLLLKQNIKLEGYSSKNSEIETQKRILNNLQEKKDKLIELINEQEAEHAKIENLKKEKLQIETFSSWYSVDTLKTILSYYYDGWSCSLQLNPQYANTNLSSILEQAEKEIIELK